MRTKEEIEQILRGYHRQIENLERQIVTQREGVARMEAELAAIARAEAAEAERDHVRASILGWEQRAIDQLGEIESLTNERQALRAELEDDPALDGTDFAHAAWWRGHHASCAMFCHHVQAILDGRDVKDESVSVEPWHTIRQRLLDMRAELAALGPVEWLRFPLDPGVVSSHDGRPIAIRRVTGGAQ